MSNQIMIGSQHGQQHNHHQQQLLLEESSMIDDNLNYKMMLMMSKMNEGVVGTLSPGGRTQSNSTPPPQSAQFCPVHQSQFIKDSLTHSLSLLFIFDRLRHLLI